MNKKKCMFITNVPARYRVAFFEELSKYYDVTVAFEKHSAADRNAEWNDLKAENFKAIFLQGISTGVDSAFSVRICDVIKRVNPDFLFILDYSSLTGMLAIVYARIHHIPYIIEGDGAFPGNGKGIKERVKYYLLSGCRIAFSTSSIHDNFYIQYGVEREKIFRYPFSSVKEKDIVHGLEQQDKQRIREELGMPEKHIILYAGQFIYRKGVDVLLKAVSQIHDKNMGVYLIGGTPTQEYLDIISSEKISNVHFVGYKSSKELNKYYDAADIFVLPTREDIWGLVINEAMARGLPIITTTKCIAGLELVSGNGTLVPSADAESLRSAIVDLFTNKDLQELSKNSIKIIQDYTVEKMAFKHWEILESMEGNERALGSDRASS